jgi:hypothetical protein
MICIIDEDHTRSATLKEEGKPPQKRKRIQNAVEMVTQYYQTNYPSYTKKLDINDVYCSKDLIVLSFKRSK